jgi:HK97 family phage major capsid protein
MLNTKELRNERAKLIDQARTVFKAGRAAEANAMLADAERMKIRIDVAERSESLFASLGHEIERRTFARGDELVSDTSRDRLIVAKMRATGGSAGLADSDLSVFASTIARDLRILGALSGDTLGQLSATDQAHYAKAKASPIQNAASTTTTTAGGFTIAPLFEAELSIALKAFGGMRSVATVIQTDTGATLPFPALDDTANQATIIGTENTPQTPGPDLAFSAPSVGGFTYAAGPMPVSLQLLQDSVFDFNGLIESAIVNRFGRKQNNDFTTGTGTTMPWGVTNSASLGTTGVVGQTTKVIYNDFVNLEHSVDPAYRAGARFMFRDSVLPSLLNSVDAVGRPLFVASVTKGTPDKIAGYPFTINQSMPSMAANAKSILFGNFSNYIIRDTRGMQITVLRERFADSLQVAWLAYMRTDGRLISGGTPIRYYQNSAT